MRDAASQRRVTPARCLWLVDYLREDCGQPPPPPPPPDRSIRVFIAGSFPIPKESSISGPVYYANNAYANAVDVTTAHLENSLKWKRDFQICSCELWANGFENYESTAAIRKRVSPTNVACTGRSWARLNAARAI